MKDDIDVGFNGAISGGLNSAPNTVAVNANCRVEASLEPHLEAKIESIEFVKVNLSRVEDSIKQFDVKLDNIIEQQAKRLEFLEDRIEDLEDKLKGTHHDNAR